MLLVGKSLSTPSILNPDTCSESQNYLAYHYSYLEVKGGFVKGGGGGGGVSIEVEGGGAGL